MKRKSVVICCSVLLALIVVLAIVFVVVYCTVLRPRSPHVAAKVLNMRVPQANFLAVPPKLNLSFDVAVTVNNPNYASFRYGDVVTELHYHGTPVGQSVVLAGEVGARTTQTVAATVELEADKVVYTAAFINELAASVFHPPLMLPFETRTTVVGKAVVAGTFKIKASSAVTCSISSYPLTGESVTECTSTTNVG
jgi:hypothetical protein